MGPQELKLAVRTPLDEEGNPPFFSALEFCGREALSHLFNFQVTLLAENRRTFGFEQLLGQHIRLSLAGPGYERYFNGICNRFSQGASDNKYTRYRMELVPDLWRLTRQARCWVYLDQSVPEILDLVLAGISRVMAPNLLKECQRRTMCVQYRETDFNFVSRLMEEGGIYYQIALSETHHVLILKLSGPECVIPSLGNVVYTSARENFTSPDIIDSWEIVQELRSGRYCLLDHSFEMPRNDLYRQATLDQAIGGATVQTGKVNHSLCVDKSLEIMDVPGEYAKHHDCVTRGGSLDLEEFQKLFLDQDRTTKIRMQQEAVPILSIHGTSTNRSFAPGSKFSVVTWPEDKRAQRMGAEGDYFLTGVTHFCRQAGPTSGSDGSGWHYHNQFECIPLAVPFRPPRLTPKPFVPGDPDRHRRRVHRGRGNPHGRVRAGQSAIQLGPASPRSERPGTLVLGARSAGVGWPALGRLLLAARRPGGGHRIRRGRCGPTDHHRQRLQRPPTAALPVRRSGSQAFQRQEG
jgi:type VI secretion system secreted protein VgrG